MNDFCAAPFFGSGHQGVSGETALPFQTSQSGAVEVLAGAGFARQREKTSKLLMAHALLPNQAQKRDAGPLSQDDLVFSSCMTNHGCG